jgi:hypothetical protein
MRDDRMEYQEANALTMLDQRLEGLYAAMDAQLPPGLLPDSYEGHVSEDLYREVRELQSRVDALKHAELDRRHEQGMEL